MKAIGPALGTTLLPLLVGACIRTDSKEARQTADAAAAAERAASIGRHINPELIKYRQVREIETGLKRPAGIAVGPADLLYVAGDSEVHIFGRDGRLQRTIALTQAPTCVAVDRNGTIFVGYKVMVTVHDPSGRTLSEWAVQGKHPHVTCVTPAGGDVWVADAGDRVVLRYDKAGTLRGRIGERDDARKVRGLIVPSPHLDVAVGPKGLLLVNNPGRLALETYTPGGRLVSSWERASMAVDGFCGCCNPTDIALLPDGRVVTSEKGIPRVKIMKPDGTLDCVVAAPETFSTVSSGLDLAVNNRKEVLVLDPRARVVRIFAEEGRP